MEDIRKYKGLHEKIMLLKVNRTEDIITFDIFSQTNKVYNITFSKNPFTINCSCMDFVYRKNVCKHIFWLGCKKIGNVEPSSLTYHIIDNFSKSYSGNNNLDNSRKNDTCGICLDNIVYNSEHTLCCSTCKYSIHLICWNSYVKVSRNTNCIMCRSNSMTV
jgi:hypothetical protein